MSEEQKEEERDDLIELIDEDGKEMKFEYLATIELNDSEYVVLLPFQEPGAEEEVDEVVILKIEYVKKSEAVYKAPGAAQEAATSEQSTDSEETEEIFVSVDDETELNAVFEEFKKRIREQYDTQG